MKSRAKEAFEIVRSHAAHALPWIRDVRFHFCPEATKLHQMRWRLFSHSCHIPMTVCWARAADWYLSDDELLGVNAHELGHVVGSALGFPQHSKPIRGQETPPAVQKEADMIADRILGMSVKYNKRTLQEIRR
jgi:hypothetical protein